MIKLMRGMEKGNLKKVIYLVLFCFGIFALVPRPTDAVVVYGTQKTISPERQKDLAKIRAVLERKEISERLKAFGLSAKEVEKRLALLSDEDIHRLAQRLDQLNPGGDLLTDLLILALIAALVVVILYYTGVLDKYTIKVEKKKKKEKKKK